MKYPRRLFLKFAGSSSALFVAAAAGLLKTGITWAAPWNKNAFEAKAVAEALKGLGASGLIESKDIIITAPDIAENGAVQGRKVVVGGGHCNRCGEKSVPAGRQFRHPGRRRQLCLDTAENGADLGCARCGQSRRQVLHSKQGSQSYGRWLRLTDHRPANLPLGSQ